MDFNLRSSRPALVKTQCLIVPVFNATQLSGMAAELDEALGGQIQATLKSGDLKSAANGKSITLYNTAAKANRIMLLACGNEKDLDAKKFSQAVATVIKELNNSPAGEATLLLPDFADAETAYSIIRQTIISAEDAVYNFTQCKSDAEQPKKPLTAVALILQNGKQKNAASKAITHGSAIANGQKLTKDLANLPGNICTPSYLADQAKELKKGNRKLKVSVLEEKQMQALGMGSLLSVSRGSRQPAKLIIIEYKGASVKQKPIVLVGKGLTFDAGGISIKPSANMDEMKYDMCGGASVLGTLQACAEMQLPINVIGVVPSSENLPDGDANKPGDIVTSMSGQTIEILNTDAEGRLILCDALTYSERFDPDVVIDIATLTGACIVALGRHASGLMSNHDALADDITNAGQESGDRVWRLPIWDDYQSQLDSNFADIANIGGPAGGTITAACFLSRFTKKFKWAHLDIAGTAWNSGGKDKGATGRPVTLLTHYLLKRAKQI